MATVREETYSLFRSLGMTTIFGNPGSTEEAFLQDFPSDFTYILALQEASAVAMADGFAQATRRPALVNLHTSAGMGNAMGNIIAAWHNKTPLVITAGQQTRKMALLEPMLYNREAIMLPKPYVKWSYEPSHAQEVPQALARACYIAMQPPAGPVFVSIPLDDWQETAQPVPHRDVSYRTSPDPARLAHVAALLNASRKPALIAGAGVDRSGGWEDLLRLAEGLNAAVWTPPMSERASFPQDHPLFQGFLPFAQKPLGEKLAENDVVLVLGAPVFRYYPYVPGPVVHGNTRLLHITDDPEEAARAPMGDSILGDVGFAVTQLADLVIAGSRPAPALRLPVTPTPPQTPIPPAFVMDVLAKLPANTIFVNESPSNIKHFYERVPIKRSGSFFFNASGGLGWAIPTSVGLKLAHPDRPVVCVIGDGSTMYSVQALWTAAQHALPIVFVVMCNGEYNILKAFAEFEKTPNVPGLDLPGLDIAKIAEGMGCASQRITRPDEFEEALQAALRSNRPTVLNVIIDAKTPSLL